MAQINISTTEQEQTKVLNALRALEGKTVSVAAVSSMTGIGQSRVRYAIVDLVDAGKVERIPIKAFNTHYIRYQYKVTV